MTFRQSALLILAAALVAMLAACGSTHHPITVAFSAPPTAVNAGSVTGLTVAITNDSANAGATWAITSCTPTNQCGTLTPGSPSTSASYQAPVSVLTGSVTITATSVTNTSVSATASFTVGAPEATLPDGNYVFQLSGEDVNGPFNVAGAFNLASGAITGEQDFVDPSIEETDNITAGTITSTTAGNLQIVLTTDSTTIGVGADGMETINVTPATSAAASAGAGGPINWFDAFASGSGTILTQNATAMAALPAAGYAFSTSGSDNDGCVIAIGGVINVDDLGGTTGTISGAGSVLDANDCGSGDAFQDQTLGASTVAGPVAAPTAPDAFGRVVFTLTPSVIGEVAFAGYIVNPSVVDLVETADTLDTSTGGIAYAQTTNTGTFSASSASVSGVTYVVGAAGLDTNGPLNYAAAVTLSSTDDTVAGTFDFNDIVNLISEEAIPAGTTYVVDTTGFDAGSGRITISTAGNNVNPAFELYLDGNGNAAVITMDTLDVTAGLAFEQTSGATIAGEYALGAAGFSPLTGDPWSAVGPISVTSGTLGSGNFTDFNYFNIGTPASSIETEGVAFTGTAASGAGSVITGLGADSILAGAPTSDTFDFYVIDSNRAFGIETDNVQTGLMFLQFQN